MLRGLNRCYIRNREEICRATHKNLTTCGYAQDRTH
jgi:hypothetical protein